MKKILPLTLLVGCFLVYSLAQVQVTVGPYLQSPTPNSIKVMWRTDSLSSSKVLYGTDKANLNQAAEDTTLRTKHMVTLTGLSPFTKYYYAIYSGNTMLEGADEQHWFRTFPVPGTELPIRVWAIGDFGKGNSKQSKTRDAYLNFDTVETNLWLWLGDNAYSDGTEQEYLTKVFDSVYGYKNNMKYMPFLPCPGNHDYNSVSPITSPTPPLTHTGPYYDFVEVYRNAEAGGVATGHELFYSFDYGNVHFISLNTEIGSLFNVNDDWTGVNLFNTFNGSPMTQWLHQDLQANTQPWVVVFMHQPPYTDGSHESGAFYEVYMKAMRQNFAPIWEQYGVDIVLCGHTHVYERSYLVKGAYGNVDDITLFNFISTDSGIDSLGKAYIKYTQGPNANKGTVYVNNGNSGSSESSANFNHPYMYAEYGCDTCCGSFIMDINGNRLDGRHLDMNGNIRDHFTMYKINGTGISNISGNSCALKVIPNPFRKSANVQFELKQQDKIVLTLTDASGKIIEVFAGELKAGNNTVEIDGDKLQLPAGVYVLQLSISGVTSSLTVVNIK